MPKWKVDKSERTEHNGAEETTTYSATILVEAEDGGDLPSLDDVADLIDNLKTERGIPGSAKLGTTINAVLNWTDADLP